MIFGWIFFWGLVWVGLILLAPIVTWFEAGSEGRNKYSWERERDAMRIKELKALHQESPLYQPVKKKKEKHKGKRQRQRAERNIIKRGK